MSRLLVFALFVGGSSADCPDGKVAIPYTQNNACLTHVECRGQEVPVSRDDDTCQFKILPSSMPCGESLMIRFEPNLTSSNLCIDFLDCLPNQVQTSDHGAPTCIDVPPANTFTADQDSLDTISFTAMHTVDLTAQYKFVLFEDSLQDVVRYSAAHALNISAENIIMRNFEVTRSSLTVEFQFPTSEVFQFPTKAAFAHMMENTVLGFEPFASSEIVLITPHTLSSVLYWQNSNTDDDDSIPFVGSPDASYSQSNGDDSVAIVIVIVVASVVFLCGVAVIMHHCRKKHTMIYAETSITDQITVAVHDEKATNAESAAAGLRVYKATKDWTDADVTAEERLLYPNPLCLRNGDIVAAYEIDGVMQGFLRGQQPQDASIEQVIQDGQFPKETVQEILGVQNYNNEFLWWTEEAEDGKQYIHWVYIKGIPADADVTCSTSCGGLTPRSDVFNTVELTTRPEDILAKTLIEKLEILQVERQENLQ